MAKKAKADDGQNKSKMIRDYMEANPTAGPKAIAEALNGQGLKVTAAYVSTIKALAKKKSGKGGKRGPGAPRGPRKAAVGGNNVLESLIQAKKLADAMGGVANAKAALDALAKLGV